MKKISYYDLNNTPIKELKKQYKASDMQIEHAVRRHMDGANADQRRDLYKQVYDDKRK